MQNRIGKGWAPEVPCDNLGEFAIRELRILLERLFNKRKQKDKQNAKGQCPT
jgi:hypothetical protein